MLIGQDITLLGAGIAGLAAARALALRGARVTVLEQAAEIGEVGAGLQVSPNGVRVLDALGLGEAARAAGTASRGVRLLDGPTGREVLNLDMARHRPGQDFLMLHRADLVALLAEGARDAGVTIETGTRIDAVSLDGPRPRLELAGGDTREAAFLVGAGGLRSPLRRALEGPRTPFFTGQVAWRALVPATGPVVPEARVFMGPRRHLVTYPLRGGSLVNIVASEERSDWADEGWSNEDDPDTLRRAFAGFGPEVAQLLARVERCHLWGLFRHEVAARWHAPGAVILGDAAHPTLPFMAQGAVMGLEDAWVLAASLAEAGLEAGPALYQQRRRPRAVRIVAAANANARNYHYANPALRLLGHNALRLAGALAPGAVLGRFDWIYGADVTRDPG